MPSPTYTLVQTYDIAGVSIHHFDLYRIESEYEAVELGIEDAFVEGIGLIEWPERLDRLAPPQMLRIALAHAAVGEARGASIVAPGDWRRRLDGRLDRWCA